MAGIEIALKLNVVRFNFLGHFDELNKLLAQTFNFLFTLLQPFLVFASQVQLLLQAFNMQLHLLLAPDVVPALGLKLLKNLFVFLVRQRNRRLTVIIQLRYL